MKRPNTSAAIFITLVIFVFFPTVFIYVQIKWSLREVGMIAFDHQKIVQ